MRSIDLAAEVQTTIERCRARVLGVGDQQYSQGDTQKFERMEFEELITWALEELDDVVVYATMLGINLKRIASVLSEQRITRGQPGDKLAWKVGEAGVAE